MVNPSESVSQEASKIILKRIYESCKKDLQKEAKEIDLSIALQSIQFNVLLETFLFRYRFKIRIQVSHFRVVGVIDDEKGMPFLCCLAKHCSKRFARDVSMIIRNLV